MPDLDSDQPDTGAMGAIPLEPEAADPCTDESTHEEGLG